MEIREIVYQARGARPYANAQYRVSIAAVVGGSMVTLASFLALSMLGAGLGAAAGPTDALGRFAVFYGFASALAAYYCGGWMAGRLEGHGHVADSVIHGVLSWSLSVLLAAFLVGSALGTFVNLAGLFGRFTPAGLLDLETFRITGFMGSLLMLLELAACAYGARAGTRAYRYTTAPPIAETLERELPG